MKAADAELVEITVKRRVKPRPVTPPKFLPRLLSISAGRATTRTLMIIAPNGKREDTDLERVLKILRDAGYSGWVALEYEAAEEPKEAIPRWIDKLKKLVDA